MMLGRTSRRFTRCYRQTYQQLVYTHQVICFRDDVLCNKKSLILEEESDHENYDYSG
jgi:hypothetical protein